MSLQITGYGNATAGNPYLANQMNSKAPQSSVNLGGLFPGASGGLQDVLKQLQQAQNQANQANQQRYKDILGTYAGLGQAGAQQIQQNTQAQQAQSTQDLTSRGLGNTTITGAMSRGIDQAGQQNQLNLQESLAGQEAGVMERMTQQGPDMSQYLGLISQAAQRQQAPATVNMGQTGMTTGGIGSDWYTKMKANMMTPNPQAPEQEPIFPGGTATPDLANAPLNWGYGPQTVIQPWQEG